MSGFGKTIGKANSVQALGKHSIRIFNLVLENLAGIILWQHTLDEPWKLPVASIKFFFFIVFRFLQLLYDYFTPNKRCS